MSDKPPKDNDKWKAVAVAEPNLPSIYELSERPLEAGLWCLCVSKGKFRTEYLSFAGLEKILKEFLDLPISALQLKRAFARAGRRVIRNSSGKEIKISQPGESYLRSLRKHEPLNVVYVSPGRPRTATKTLETLIKSLRKGTLLIADPYYGVKTFDVLEAFAKHHKEIRFLTTRIGGGEKQTLVSRVAKDFQKEFGKKVQVKLTSTNDLHDRYIISEGAFFLVGQGIKDLGNKESFIVGVEDRYGKDIRKSLEKLFDQRWASATPLGQ